MADDPAPSDPAAIPTIRRLDEAVVNRIAAGEVGLGLALPARTSGNGLFAARVSSTWVQRSLRN